MTEDMTDVPPEVLTARLMLGWVMEPGSKALHDMVSALGPVRAWERIAAGAVRESLRGRVEARLKDTDPKTVLARLLADADRLGATILVPESPQWPSSLDDLIRFSVDGREPLERDTYPPQALWLRGPMPFESVSQRGVAIVGARANTNYGGYMASDLSSRLAALGWVIISGGAYGIDAHAHRGALSVGGNTIAVLASGVDRAYPPGNTTLFEQIAETGLLISEWPPGSAPHRVRFLIRNRVIAALARGTILVEAAARSGARQTMRRSRQLGRRLMAVPGPANSNVSVGCHEELRNEGDVRVRLVASAEHVLEEIGAIGDDLATPPKGPARHTDPLTTLEKQIVDATPLYDSARVPEIAAIIGLPVTYVMAALPSLELRGYVLRESDGSYRLPQRA